MKFLTIAIIITGMILLFNAGGIETASGGLVKIVIDNGLSSIKMTELWNKLMVIFDLAIGVGAVASLIGRAPDPSLISAGFASLFGGLLLADMISIWQQLNTYTSGWIKNIVLLIMVLMVMGFFATFLSWWKGDDG